LFRNWTTGAPPRHTATALADGRVLAAGGFANPDRLASAEVYDPWRGAWTPVGPMNRARERHRAVLLPQAGSVLLVGGYDAAGWHSFAELFDPETGEFEVAPQPQAIGGDFTLTPLGQDRAIATGGLGTGTQVQVFDLRLAGWYVSPALPVGLYGHVAEQAADGRVLVAGGYNARAFTNADTIPDPQATPWTEVGQSIFPHANASSAVLGGRIAMFGNGVATQIWDPQGSQNDGPADYHLSASSPLVNAGNPYILDQDRGRSDIGMYGGRAPQMRSSSASPAKATVTSTVKFSCYFADLLAPQKVEVILGSGHGTLAATSTDTWPANDATYTASLTNPPLGKYYYKCHAVTAEGLDVYYPKPGSYKYLTVDVDLDRVRLASPVEGTIVPSSTNGLEVDIRTTKGFYGYSVRIYYSMDGVKWSYKTVSNWAYCCGAESPDQTYRYTLLRGTHFNTGTLYLYAYARDGNGPTMYDKNGGAFYKLTVQ
jgi:hypothetical protein